MPDQNHRTMCSRGPRRSASSPMMTLMTASGTSCLGDGRNLLVKMCRSARKSAAQRNCRSERAHPFQVLLECELEDVLTSRGYRGGLGTLICEVTLARGE